MEAVWQSQWSDQNANRRYPLAHYVSAVDTTGAFRIPDDFLVGLQLTVGMSASIDPTRFFVKSVSVFAGGYGVVVGYQPPAGDAVAAATAMIPKPGLEPYASFSLGGVGDFADAIGRLTIGRTGNIDIEPAGSWDFTFETAGLDPDCIRPCLRGVSGIRVRNGTQVSPLLTGIVELIAGANSSLGIADAETDNPKIIINHIQGEGTVEQCVCEGDSPIRDPIYSIGGVFPDADGSVYVLGSDCLTVTEGDAEVRLDNPCSKPCCGPAELEAITRDLKTLIAESVGVTSFTEDLSAAITAFTINVLGSKLNDRGCADC